MTLDGLGVRGTESQNLQKRCGPALRQLPGKPARNAPCVTLTEFSQRGRVRGPGARDVTSYVCTEGLGAPLPRAAAHPSMNWDPDSQSAPPMSPKKKEVQGTKKWGSPRRPAWL